MRTRKLIDLYESRAKAASRGDLQALAAVASNKAVDEDVGDHHDDEVDTQTFDSETDFSMSTSLESESINSHGVLDFKERHPDDDEGIPKGFVLHKSFRSRLSKSNSSDHHFSNKHLLNTSQDTVITASTMSSNQSSCSDPSTYRQYFHTPTPSSSSSVTPSVTSTRAKVDEEALHIGKILSEQEFLFGFNMYDIPRTEEDMIEINRLIQVHTCSEHQALLVIFEKKYNTFRPKVHQHRQQQQKLEQQLNKQTQQQQEQHQQEHQFEEHQDLSHQQMTEEQKALQLFQQLCTTDPQEQHTEQQQLELEARLVSGQLEKSFKGLSSSRPKTRDVRDAALAYEADEAESFVRAIQTTRSKSFVARTLSFLKGRSSRKEEGKESKEGRNHREEKRTRKQFKYKDKDVQALMDMGFSRYQSVQALIENRNSVQSAAEQLLRGC